MKPRWIKIDHKTMQFAHLSDSDCCVYAREYVSRGGYAASEANDLITNFKKPTDRKGAPEWVYKEQAITRFAIELKDLLPLNAVVSDIPPSQSKSDPQYDDRLAQTLIQLSKARPDVLYLPLLTANDSLPPAHLGGARDPDTLYENLVWIGPHEARPKLLLVDDIITCGGHFAACKRKILDAWPNCDVIGIFWARAVDPSQ